MTTVSINNKLRLEEFCRQRLAQRRVILASNRGPVEYHLNQNEELQTHRGSGGVVTVLTSLGKYVKLDWIANAMGEGDRQAARMAEDDWINVNLDNESLNLRFLNIPRSTYHKFYSIFCNPLLWFLQHYMWNSPRTPNIDGTIYDAWENGYIPVNKAFAEAVIDEVAKGGPAPIVLLNDYHLYLAGGYIREQLPDLVIQHFTHIPWPSPCYWQLLPGSMVKTILSNLCAADIVGLQTQRDVRSFLYSCETFIEAAEIDHAQQLVQINGHCTRVKAYPVSIDVAYLNELVSSDEVRKYENKLRPLYGEQTIVRVDRTEPSKNIIRGLRAFDALLGRYPQFLGKLKLVAFLVPTRSHLRPYQRYMQDVMQSIEAINDRYGTKDWQPVSYFYENNYAQAIAGMRLYDVLLVNAVIDGMNLVAKEGPTVNERDGVLVLSETVGACEQLGHNALTVAPTDLEGTMRALYEALTMPVEEKSRRATALKKSIEEEDITIWLLNLLEDATRIIDERSGITT